ncbi:MULTISPECIES: hypothetical protein [Streptomyces]|uniref:Lipoprotein n=1 Tax=Streptomyces chartreusis NRRL 3882 TaxID=1079985 RepID=A0A2N9B7H6_STRCX|nr:MULTISPECIES: hypothetical protein [Streptomyces]MYS92262.1 hypothetical protein [Streptomyces sp. SID5464]SOR79314.1 hypothetical protein SCNRRL3882_2776 [Streptomyces chartreusis NRRL 3882]
MRGTVRRAHAAGLVIGVLMTGLTACTGDGGAAQDHKAGRPTAAACANGTFGWSHVTTRDRLTGISDPERLGAGGGARRNPMRRVYTPSPSVRAENGPAPSAAEILFSLGRKTGEIDSDAPALAEAGGDTWAFTDVRQPAPRLDDDRISPRAAGEFYRYAGVREVSADFRYTCPDGRTVSGRARNWTVDLAGVADCDERPDSALAREAAQHACGQARSGTPSPSGA